MPESSKLETQGAKKRLTHTGESIVVGEQRSDKESANTIGTLQLVARYTVQGLQKENNQETARKWVRDKTDELKQYLSLGAVPADKTGVLEQYPDLAAVLEQMSYASSDTPAETHETGIPAIPVGEVQAVPSGGGIDVEVSPHDLIERLAAPDTSRATRQQLVCTAELLKFSQVEQETLLELLWRYILDCRDSNDSDELVAVGSAIRKFAAIIPMDRMELLAKLIEPGHRAALAVELELEVAKMVYRNFEVHPPAEPDQQSELTEQLWRLARDYLNPRFLLREKHSAVASLAIEALIAMRSSVAEVAWRAALECPYRWFGEMVSDHVATLQSCWVGRSDSAVAWLDDLQSRVMAADL